MRVSENNSLPLSFKSKIIIQWMIKTYSELSLYERQIFKSNLLRKKSQLETQNCHPFKRSFNKLNGIDQKVVNFHSGQSLFERILAIQYFNRMTHQKVTQILKIQKKMEQAKDINSQNQILIQKTQGLKVQGGYIFKLAENKHLNSQRLRLIDKISEKKMNGSSGSLETISTKQSNKNRTQNKCFLQPLIGSQSNMEPLLQSTLPLTQGSTIFGQQQTFDNNTVSNVSGNVEIGTTKQITENNINNVQNNHNHTTIIQQSQPQQQSEEQQSKEQQSKEQKSEEQKSEEQFEDKVMEQHSSQIRQRQLQQRNNHSGNSYQNCGQSENHNDFDHNQEYDEHQEYNEQQQEYSDQ